MSSHDSAVPLLRRVAVAVLLTTVLTSGALPPGQAQAADDRSPIEEPSDAAGGVATPALVVERPPIELGSGSGGGAGDAAALVGLDMIDPSIEARPVTRATNLPDEVTPVASDWTEQSRTYANPDGTFTLESSIGRLNFRDEAGAWQELDLSLARQESDAYGLRVMASDRSVQFGDSNAEVALARLEGDGHTVSLRALDFATDAVTSGLEPQEPAAEPAATPAASPTPTPTPTPVETSQPSPEPSGEPVPEAAPGTAEPIQAAGTPTPSQTATPEPSATPEATATPAPTLDPEPTVAPPVPVAENEVRFTKDESNGQISLRPTDYGFRFGVVLDSATQSNTYAFALDLGGLRATVGQDGQTIELWTLPVDEGDVATRVGYISAPIMVDALEQPARPDTVTVEVYQPSFDSIPPTGVTATALDTLASTEIALVYTIDEAWLTDPARAFPVVLDPDACIGAGASGCDITAANLNFDHFVMSGMPTQYPTGWSVLRVGRVSADYDRMRSLLYFRDISSLPDGAVIYDTNLRMHVSSLLGGASGKTINAYRINDAWGQTTTWNGFNSGAAYDTSPVASGTVPASGNMNIDVDPIVQSWYTRRAKDWEPNIGIALKMDSETDANGVAQFDRYSDSTAANRPLLVMHYEVPKVAIDFDPALGTNYAPSTMLAGGQTTLPVRVTNNGSGFDFKAPDWTIGYRWFNHKGNFVSAGQQAISTCIGTGSGCVTPSATFPLTIDAPTNTGQYTLRLDLVRNETVDQYASDWAKPSLLYSRNKKVLSADNTRWTGSSVIERDEFSIAVVAGGGDAGETRAVATGDGGELGINLWSKNLHYEGAGGVGLDDLIPLELDYRYDSKFVTDCGGILDACGWSTNWDERFIEGTAGRSTYVGPSGNRYLVDSDADQQLISGAPVLLQRPRITLFDENVPTNTPTAKLVDPPSNEFHGPYAVEVSATPTSVSLGSIPTVNLNTYRTVRFALKTSGGTSSAGVGFKIKNVRTNDSKWFVYAFGPSSWTSGEVQLFQTVTLGSTDFTAFTKSLYADVNTNGTFGTTYDEYEITDVSIFNRPSASGQIYLDDLHFEAGSTTIIDGSEPNWTTNGTLADTHPDAVTGATSVKVNAAPISGSPDCNTTSPANCWSTSAGGLHNFGFVAWHWKKVGGSSAAIVFHLEDVRTGVGGDITYYAGPTAPVGALNPIQVSDATPVGWSKVTRNLLRDAQQVLNFYNDTPSGTTSASPPTQGPSADDVQLRGYKVSAVDGSFLLLDDFRYSSLPDVAYDTLGAPASKTDTTFVYDFSATYADGSVHYFNNTGLLERIANRDGHIVDLDWSASTSVVGQNGYTLAAIHAATDGSTAPSGLYDRELAVTYPAGTVSIAEKLGTTAAPITGRSTVFTVTSGDLLSVKPARAVSCAPSGASGCAKFEYAGTHLLAYVGDPRWDGATTSGANDKRFGVTWNGSDPKTIIDRSTGGVLLRVNDYGLAGGALPAATRAAWQDAAGIRGNFARYIDLTSDGGALYQYIPLTCQASDCATLPATGSLANNRANESQFDGLARESTSIAYRCPAVSVSGCTGTTAQKVVSRQGSKAGAKVDNYNDPLAAGQTGWTQSADQYLTSLRDSGGADPDLYRTFYAYDENGQQVSAARPVHNARADYAATIKSTTDPASGLKGYWRLGESSGTNAADATGTAAGTYTGSVTLNQPDALVNDANPAATFDGTNDVVPINSALGTVSGDFSVAAWARPTSATTTMAFVGSRKLDVAANDFTFDAKFYYSSGARYIRVNVGTGTAWLLNGNFPFDYEANRWYQVVVVVDNAADLVRVFVNGQPIGTLALGSGTPRLADSTRVLRIGNNGRASGSGEWFNGTIDEVAVYTKPLTATQVQAHYLAAHSVALETERTLYDPAWRPLQVDDQLLASAGFESGLTEWSPSGGSLHTASSTSDANVHQPPADSGLPPSWASFSTGSGGKVQQDVTLVPGQTFRAQVWDRRSGTSGAARIDLDYWERSSGTWQELVGDDFTDSSSDWTGHAWDVTLPLDTDGRVRLTLSSTSVSGSDTIYFDDVAILTTFGRTTYTSTAAPANDPYNGLVRDAVTLSPSTGAGAPAAELRNRNLYEGNATHPPIFPTTTTTNIDNGAFSSSEPDEDVSTTSAFDAWGRATSVTDQDGVSSTTTYQDSASTNGWATDVESTSNLLSETTEYGYDEVGNRLSIKTPEMTAPTTTSYDLRGHPLVVDPPAGPSSKDAYDAYGFRTSSIANWVNDSPSGPAGLDDVVTTFDYDQFGALVTTIGNDGVSGTAATKTAATHDLLGNTVETTVYAAYDGTTFSGQRDTTQRFETAQGYWRPKPSAVRGPDSLARDGNAPACPDGSSDDCDAVSVLDQDGQAVASIDAYGVTTRTFRDIAGNPVFVVANYDDGAYDPADPDEDIVSTTQYDLFGRAQASIDVFNRRTATDFDRLGRPTAVWTGYLNTSQAWVPISVSKTVYTGAGRVDRTSLNDDHDMADASRTWTKTVYDKAGRAIKTLGHYDTSKAAGIALASFERAHTDTTIDNDDVAEAWAPTGTFIASGATITRESVAPVKSGNYRLRVTLGTGANTGTEWSLDGDFKAGRTYKARVWVSPASQTITGKLGVVASSGTATVSGTGYQALDLTWTPGVDQNSVKLALYRTGTGSAVDVHVDNAIVWDDSAKDRNIPTETAYDKDGRVIVSVIVPGTLGTTEQPLVTATAYDQIGRVTSVTANVIAGGGTGDSTSNLTTTTDYDDLGRVKWTIDPTTTKTVFGYDRLGRVTATTLNYVDGSASGQYAADDVRSEFGYNAAGELVGSCTAVQVYATGCNPTDPAEIQAWRYAFDAAGRLTRQTPPDNATQTDLASTIWMYDAGGRLTKTCSLPGADDDCSDTGVLRNSVPTYDAVGRVTRLDTRSGPGTTLALRAETDYLGDGQTKEVRASEGTTPTLVDTIGFGYDTLGRQTSVTRNGSTALSAATYDPDGTLASRTDGDGGAIGTTTFDYDWAKRLTEVDLPDATFSTAKPGFAWRLDGLIESRDWSGTSATFGYDAAKRPTSITKGSLTLGQAYDRDGNVTVESRSFPNVSGDPGTGSQTFSYDALNRVTGSSGLAQSRSYTYDRDSSRRTKTVGSDTWTYVHDRTDQLASVQKNALGLQNFGYDAYGNLTTDAQTGTGTPTAMNYDLADRLMGIDTTGTTTKTSFTLDALGRFKTRTVGTSSPLTDTYSYVGASETVARIATAGGTTLDSIVSPAGDRLGVKAGATLNWFVPDLHGNVAASLEADETDLANAIRYDAWGETIQTGAAPGGGSAAGADAWKYQGRLDVSPAGLATPLYDMSARFYAPGIAAFTQLDSVAGSAQNPLSMNRFLYAHANPATLIDPTGHAALEYDNYSTPGRTSYTTSSGTRHMVYRSTPRKSKPPSQSHSKKTFKPPLSVKLQKEARLSGGDYVEWANPFLLAESKWHQDLVADSFFKCISEIDGACSLHKSLLDAEQINHDGYCSAHRAYCDAVESERNASFWLTVGIGVETAILALALVDLIPGDEGAAAGAAATTIAARQGAVDRLQRLTTIDLPPNVTWGRPQTLAGHFGRHGLDFGASSANDYARMASQFFQRGLQEGLPTKLDPRTGVIRIYERETNTFGVYNPNGTTATFYKPDPAIHGYASNWEYWLDQKGVAPWSPE